MHYIRCMHYIHYMYYIKRRHFVECLPFEILLSTKIIYWYPPTGSLFISEAIPDAYFGE